MDSAIVDPALVRYKSAIAQLLTQLKHFAQSIQNPQLTATVEDLLENINQPFLFVVIGEVKAGKSSFINALLGSEEVCEVGADPRTNMVAKIVYTESDGYSRESKPGKLREIGRPVEILKQIAIVDTPGTNSPAKEHEEITKAFIPNSDLVVFVFFSKNPYTNTAWSLVDFAHTEWKKPVIFVLQQADLAEPRELEASKRYIKSEAQQRHIAAPNVFATSAKFATISDVNPDRGGFTPVQDFIRSTITGGQGYRLKLRSNIGAAEQIVSRLGQDVQLLEKQLEIDEAVVTKIRDRLGQGQSQSRVEIDTLVERLMAQYERATYQLKSEFRSGLSLTMLAKRSILSVFNRQQRIETWVNDLKKKAQADLEETLDQTAKEGAKRFLNGIQQLIQQLLSELTALQNDSLRKTEISLPLLDYRYEVIEDVKAKVASMLEDETFIDCLSDTADSAGAEVNKGIIAVIGGAIATVTRFVWLDILGTAFLGLGVFWVGGSLISKRRRIIKQFESELDRNKLRFESTVTAQLNARLQGIYDEINQSFIDLYDYVEKERLKISPLLSDFEKIQQHTTSLAQDIRNL